MKDSEALCSMDYGTVIKHLHKLLLDHPVVVFIDALGQLFNDNQARRESFFEKFTKSA